MPRAPAARRRTRASRALPPRRRSCCAETPASEFATLRRAETGSVVATAEAHDGNGMRKRHRCRQHTGARMQAPARTLDAASAVASWACAPRVSRRLERCVVSNPTSTRQQRAAELAARGVVHCLPRSRVRTSEPSRMVLGRVAEWQDPEWWLARSTTTHDDDCGLGWRSGQLTLRPAGVGQAIGLTEAKK